MGSSHMWQSKCQFWLFFGIENFTAFWNARPLLFFWFNLFFKIDWMIIINTITKPHFYHELLTLQFTFLNMMMSFFTGLFLCLFSCVPIVSISIVLFLKINDETMFIPALYIGQRRRTCTKKFFPHIWQFRWPIRLLMTCLYESFTWFCMQSFIFEWFILPRHQQPDWLVK